MPIQLTSDQRRPVVCALGIAQTIAWASSYYLPAILATPAAAELGFQPVWIFAAFSFAMMISALIGPWAGRQVDRHGGRGVLAGSNLLFALGLVLFATSQNPASILAAWVVLGIAMGLGLYDTAFATLARLFGTGARAPIYGITLIAGFASTIGWPLSGYIEAQYDWRVASLVWAALHMVIALPLNLVLPNTLFSKATEPSPTEQPKKKFSASLQSSLLALVFATTAFTGTAMAAHLPRLIEAAGATTATAIAAGALIGPAQVFGRLLEFGFLRNLHPIHSAKIATLTHPLGVILLVFGGGGFAYLFAFAHGTGNGILTIARGTLPLALFGADGYGFRQGLIAAPARVAQAVAPVAFGFALAEMGAASLWIGAGLGILAYGALRLIQRDL
ncbi:MAG: MFS transporter [Rhizobiales bacterium]|nr:MFS transporter [Hyphomicrobiales bacterium]